MIINLRIVFWLLFAFILALFVDTQRLSASTDRSAPSAKSATREAVKLDWFDNSGEAVVPLDFSEDLRPGTNRPDRRTRKVMVTVERMKNVGDGGRPLPSKGDKGPKVAYRLRHLFGGGETVNSKLPQWINGADEFYLEFAFGLGEGAAPGAYAIAEFGNAQIKIETLKSDGRIGDARVLVADEQGVWKDLEIAVSGRGGTGEVTSPLFTIAVSERNATWDLYAGGLKIAENLHWKQYKQLSLKLSSSSDSTTAFVERVVVGSGELVSRRPDSRARVQMRRPKPEHSEFLRKKGIIVDSDILEQLELAEEEVNDD